MLARQEILQKHGQYYTKERMRGANLTTRDYTAPSSPPFVYYHWLHRNNPRLNFIDNVVKSTLIIRPVPS